MVDAVEPPREGAEAALFPEEGHTVSDTLPEEFAGSSGKVVRVQLVNFLNHANLVVNCSPYLNMIFGMNGQGKSAIVQGMALCFGGYGHSAGRDTALAHYIKDYHLRNGPSFARVELTISNHGNGAYKPEVYGDVVILTRKIQRNSSTFYMGGALAKKSAVTKKELKAYLRHIQMNIGSPTTYMDQETSKSFFFQSNPSSFYRYYSAAAGLVEMEENLSTEKRNLEDCKAELKVRKRVLVPDREKLRELSKQIKLFEEKVNEWKSAKEMYKLSQYRADKERYDALKETYDRFSQSNPKDEIVKLKESIELFGSEQEELKTEMQTLTSTTFTQKEKITTTTDQIAVINDSINDKQSCVAALEASMAQVEAAMGNLDSDIAAMEAEPADMEKQRLETELEGCKEEYDAVDQQQKSMMVKISDLESVIAEIEMQLSAARSDLEDQKRENASLAVGGTARARAENFRRALYRYDVNQVREDIYKMRGDGLFEHAPIGPIGEYLVVSRDVPSWKVMSVVERHLRNMFQTWVVATEKDRRALESLLMKHGCSRTQARVMKSNLFMHPDLVEHMQKQTAKSAHADSIYRYLAVKEIPPVLLYLLSDTCDIGRTIICADDEHMEMLLDNVGDEFVTVYSLKTLKSARYINGSLHLTPCYDKHPFSYEYVKVAHENEKDHSWRHEERRDSGLERERSLCALANALSKELAEANTRLNEYRTELEDVRTNKTAVIRKRTRIEADLMEEIDHLESTNHSSKFNKYCDAMNEIRSEYRNQLKDLEAEKVDLEAQIASFESDKAKQEQELQSANNELKETLKRISGIKVDIQKIQQRVNIQKTQIKALEKNMKDYHFKLDGYMNDMKEAETRLCAHKAEMDSEGIDYSSDLPTKAPEEYLKIINLSNDVLQRMVDDARNVESHLVSLRDTHEEFQRSLQEKERRLAETTENYRLHKQNYVKRCKRFEECRDRIERKAKRTFRQTLEAVTGYDGNLVFNDVDRTLEIQIHNRQQSYSRAHVATDLKTLSGGEQSAIQLSMLQSMASISFSPVHMFDEVDVYMDESTRVKNIESLVQFAANNQDRQFFLVTPHSELAKHIKDNYPDISKIFNVSKDT
ncbi:structural maintenance of chromosome 6 [Babesia ovis]|uniref:Structural maintenance of chromosome 6 n=1 Tax=Babesia ovis TaxID=5869 RepID=A0A9W5WWF2_BABOV|nr:structural maintenance of chromosome 6 [Babesia ovis]